jgi:hypothetical protein
MLAMVPSKIVVLGRLEGLDGLAGAHLCQEVGQAADLADGLHPLRKALAGQVLLQVELEHAVGDTVLGLQLGLVEAGQRLQLALQLAPGLRAVGGGRRVDEAVVVARVAQRRGEDGLALQHQFPLGVQPLVEALAFGGGGCPGGQGECRTEGKAGGQQAQGMTTAHGLSGWKWRHASDAPAREPKGMRPYNLPEPRLCGAVVVCRSS